MTHQHYRPVRVIVADIARAWPDMWSGAHDAYDRMVRYLGTPNEVYYVRAFLRTAASWRGESARRLKRELRRAIEPSSHGSE